MRTVETLTSANKNMKAGNHRVQFNDYERYFYYYSTPICIVNDREETFIIDSSYGTQSTTRACNAYRREFESQGYKEIQE